MREIKFMAWHKTLSIMFEVFGFDVNHVIPFYKNGLTIMENIPTPPTVDEVILLQFTGIKDRNGKEIYEGNIVRHNEFVGAICFGKYRNPTENSWNIGFYIEWVDEITEKTIRKDMGFWEDIVSVVGNIYENPELLK